MGLAMNRRDWLRMMGISGAAAGFGVMAAEGIAQNNEGSGGKTKLFGAQEGGDHHVSPGF